MKLIVRTLILNSPYGNDSENFVLLWFIGSEVPLSHKSDLNYDKF